MDQRLDRPMTAVPVSTLEHALKGRILTRRPSLAPSCKCLKTDITSQTVTEHESKDVDCILTAVLLASHLGGSAAAIQEWLGGFKEGAGHNCSTTRVQLAAASNCARGRRWTAW
jgi:hypothetical protein